MRFVLFYNFRTSFAASGICYSEEFLSQYIMVLESDQLDMDHRFLCYLLTKCIKLTHLSGHTHRCV